MTREVPQHPAHASLLPRTCLGMIDLEDTTVPQLAMEAIGARIASRAEDDDLRRAFPDGGQGQLVDDARANLVQEHRTRQSPLDVAARQMAHDR